MKNICKIFKFALLPFLILTINQSFAQIIEAESCSQEDVQAAIDLTTDGDTVKVPAGTGVWDQAVTIGKQLTWGDNPTFESKEVILQGAGIGNTTIISSVGYGGTLLVVIGIEGKPIRITGFTFKGMKRGSTTWPAISLRAPIWRIDHCKFDASDADPWTQGRGLMVSGQGLIDHCNFIDCYQSIAVFGKGDASWNRALSPGTSDAVYIENCTIDNTKIFDGALDAYGGARYVFRYNTIINEIVGHHGRDSGGYRSPLWFEYYHNTFECTVDRIWVAANFRGGTGVMFNNDWTGNYGGNIRVVYYCAIPNNPSCGWETCTTYPCMDQTGRGPDMNHDGVQDLVPLYEWDNTKNGGDMNINVESYSSFFIQDGRDYYSNTFNPEYIPYPYPHAETLADYPGQQRSLDLENNQSPDGIGLSWKLVVGAVNYRVLCDWQEIGIVTGNLWEITVPVSGHVYMVYALDGDNNILAAEGKLFGNAQTSTDPIQIENIYPNPFNTETTISFIIKETGDYQINIYNILGQKVKHLFKGEYTAGQQQIIWDRTNNYRKKVQQGVYIVKINSGADFTVGRIVVLK